MRRFIITNFISKIISTGNSCIMDTVDFLEYLADDPDTGIIALYLEGIRDGSRLTSLIREINLTKPVIVWKGGLTGAGARAAASHTGSLAGEQEIWEAFYKQTGAVQVFSLDELADVIMTFLYLTPPQGRRVAIFIGSGGHSVTAADFCAREGLEVPPLSPETKEKLREFVPVAGTSIENPLDTEMILHNAGLFGRGLEAVIADTGIDILIIDQSLDLLIQGGVENVREVGRLMCRFSMDDSNHKSMVAVLESWGGNPAVGTERGRLQRELSKNGIVVFRSLPRAYRAVSRFTHYHEFLRREKGC